jgi:hypothetical protein
MYVSVTGLRPKSFAGTLRFWLLAVPSFRQAQTAQGNMFCAVKKINGHQCTLTAWESREQMLNFMRSGVHLKAMKAFGSIATGKTYGYETDTIPGWDEAFALLQEKGRVY